MKIAAGRFKLDTPRDLTGTFEPQIVNKHQTHLTDELERKVIALFALGNSYQDIHTHIADMTGSIHSEHRCPSGSPLRASRTDRCCS